MKPPKHGDASPVPPIRCEPTLRRGASREAAAVADERVQLLARKYGPEPWTDADQGALNALTARLDVLVPQVTDADRVRLDAMRRDAERTMAEVSTLLHRLDA